MIMEVDHLVLGFEIEIVIGLTDTVLHATAMSGMETGVVVCLTVIIYLLTVVF